MMWLNGRVFEDKQNNKKIPGSLPILGKLLRKSLNAEPLQLSGKRKERENNPRFTPQSGQKNNKLPYFIEYSAHLHFTILPKYFVYE